MDSSKNFEESSGKIIVFNKLPQSNMTGMHDNFHVVESPKEPSCRSSNSCEQQIDFLNQCKSALSSEVVRWKSESHKLQKEKEKLRKECGEIKSMMNALSQSNAQLDKELKQIIQENEKLKMHALAVGEENSLLHSRLTRSLAKFHSYPWSGSNLHSNKKNNFTSSLNSKESVIFQNRGGTCISDLSSPSKQQSSESWEEVSQKLLSQMKQEMKELQELNNKLALQASFSNESELSEDNKSACNCNLSYSIKDEKKEDFFASCSESQFDFADISETQETIHELKLQISDLKQEARSQNINMQKLLLQILSTADFGTQCFSENKDGKKDLKTDSNTCHNPDIADYQKLLENKMKFTRPSDESFRAYFTQQLHGGKMSWEEKASHSSSKTSEASMCEAKKSGKNVYFTEEKNKGSVLSGMRELDIQCSSKCKDKTIPDVSLPERNMCNSSQNRNSSVTSRLTVFPEETAIKMPLSVECNQIRNTDDERICPMCQAVFPKIVSQHEFETHVVSHFESEGGSLLNQFEVI